MPSHYIKLNYITLHYITLEYGTVPYITSHCMTHFNQAANFRSATNLALSEQVEAFAVLVDEGLWAEVAAHPHTPTAKILHPPEP